MVEQKQTNPQYNPLPDLPNYDPEPADGVRVGESPVPGITLRRILRGHTDRINRIAWSPDGRFLASPSEDQTIRIWDVQRGECVTLLEEGKAKNDGVAWSPDGRLLALGAMDSRIRIWNTKIWEVLFVIKENNDEVNSVAWSPDGHLLASGSLDSAIRVWDVANTKQLYMRYMGIEIWCVTWSPDGRLLASGGDNGEIFLLDVENKDLWSTLEGHNGIVYSVAWSPDGHLLASGSSDSTIRIWDVVNARQLHIFEAHTNVVHSIAFSSDGRLLVSKSDDETVRFWEIDTGLPLATLYESDTSIGGWESISFQRDKPILATLAENNTSVRVWDLDINLLLSQTATDSVRYTTAKLVLVGDSGVGKTGLGWRLAHGEFKEHASTHGQQFWVVDDLCTTRADGTECEAVLWDLAGQHIYRSIHAMFLDNVDASLVLFDPTNRQEPLKGAEFWLEQLAQQKKLPPSVLVGARLDRGTSVLSQEELAQFCQKYGISGGYIGTSAKEGHGLDELLENLKDQIPWGQMTATVTTRTFKRVKEYVLDLKEKSDRKGVLVGPAELRHQLEASDAEWEFSDAEMMTAVGHLQTHGYVTILHSSSGEEHILLTPELLVSLASSIVLQADKHPQELGALDETNLLQGRYPLTELNNLEIEEQQIMLDAAVTRFLEYNICFRETLGRDTLLIFPSLIKQKRPLQDDVEAVDDISYTVRGRVENIYSALVVLLGFTRTFTRVNQWQRQAQYEMGEGNICGFRLIEDVEGEIELVLYYSLTMPEFGRSKFQGLFEEFLYQRDVQITRFPPVLCSDKHLQARGTVVKRLREGKQFLFCEECGQKIELPDIESQPIADVSQADWIQREDALVRLRSAYETYLTRIKAFRRDRAAPRCYISNLPAQDGWVGQLTDDLRDAGVHIITDRDELSDNDLILIADTPTYQQSFKNNAEAIAADATLIRVRLRQGQQSSIVNLLLDGKVDAALPTEIRPGDFRHESHYAMSLFDLVLTLYAIPYHHLGFAPLRKALRQQWMQMPKEGYDQGDDKTISSSVNREAIQNQINAHEARLEILELQEAKQGISVDPAILTEIKEIKAKITELRVQLGG